MRQIALEELLEAGCHFGHQVTRQNPKARDYVFEARDNIHIIDLGLTKKGLEEAAEFIKNLAIKEESTLVVVGSKRQAAPIIGEETKRAKSALAEKSIPDGLFTVTSRWIGGTFTNSDEVAKNYKRLRDLEVKLKDDFEKAKYTKKEIGMWEKERQKLEMFYGGIAAMKHLPSAIFIVDTHLESLAVREAHRMGVKTVGIVDTNADPTLIDYVIPANDDAVGSIELIVKYIIDAWIEGKTQGAKLILRQAQNAVEQSQGIKAQSENKAKEEGIKNTPAKAASAKSSSELKEVKKEKIEKKPKAVKAKKTKKEETVENK